MCFRREFPKQESILTLNISFLSSDDLDKKKSEDGDENEDNTMFGTGLRYWALHHNEGYRLIYHLEKL